MSRLKNSKIGRKGGVSIPIMAGIALVVIILMIAIPVAFLKINIVKILKIEYKHSNADLALLGILSYPDVRQDITLYVSGLEGNKYSVNEFDKTDFKNKVEDILDNLVSSECYNLTYQVGSAPRIPIIDKNKKIEGEACNPQLWYSAKTFVIVPYGQSPVKLMLEIT